VLQYGHHFYMKSFSDLHSTVLRILLVFYIPYTVHLSIIFVNKPTSCIIFFLYIYFYSLHVSGSHVPHHQENWLYHCNTCYMLLCVDDRLVCRAECIPTCIPDGHLHWVTYTRCRIDTVNSPDDGRMAARIMHRVEINI
jgi:hypothetical protein